MNPLFSKQMNRQQAMPTMAELREKLKAEILANMAAQQKETAAEDAEN